MACHPQSHYAANNGQRLGKHHQHRLQERIELTGQYHVDQDETGREHK